MINAKRTVSPLIASILLIALTVSIGAMIIGWGRQYVQQQTSCLGVSVQLSDLWGGTNGWNITVTNSGEQVIQIGRLKSVVILEGGGKDVKDINGGLKFYQLNGTPITDVKYSINPGESIIAEVPYPAQGTGQYIYFEHAICGEISNRILTG